MAAGMGCNPARAARMLEASGWTGAGIAAFGAVSCFSDCLKPKATRRLIGGLPGGVDDGTSSEC